MGENKNVKIPLYKKWWFWLIIVGVIALIIIGAVFGGNPDTFNKNKDEDTVEKAKTYGLNQVVKVNGFEVTVLNVEDKKQIGIPGLGKETQNNFVILTISIRNISPGEKTITESFFKYNRAGVEYKHSDASLYLEGGFWLAEAVGTGITRTIKIVYEIPTKHQASDYILVGGLFDSEKIYLK